MYHLSNLFNNIIDWNNIISNLQGQSNEKLLQFTERQFHNSRAIWFVKQHMKNVKEKEM